MIRKTTIAVLAVIASLCFSIPAAAETFVSADGVLSIELPNENWKQIMDLTKWITFSDGENVISIDHFSNGEKLPEISVADKNYANVYQAVFSTQNEVFIITGSVADTSKITEIATSIVSAKVLKYDTKLAVVKEPEAEVNGYLSLPMDETMYVTAEWLNVRTSCSTEAQIIGGFAYGTAVKVIGTVHSNGEDLGWYQVMYGNETGYAFGQYLSKTAPAPQEKSSETSASKTETKSVTVYDENGNSYKLYLSSDGYWREEDGSAYSRLSDTEFQRKDGNKRVTTEKPSEEEEEPEFERDFYDTESETIFDEMGNSFKVYLGSDGYWREEDGTTYIRLSDTEFQRKDGNKRLTTDDPDMEIDDEDDAVDYEDDEEDEEFETDRDFYDTESVTVYDEAGNSFKLYLGSDGYWREEEGTTYIRLSDTEFQKKDGNKRVSTH